jgi:hypothetical protein
LASVVGVTEHGSRHIAAGYAREIKGAKFVFFGKNAHMTMNEEPTAYDELFE